MKTFEAAYTHIDIEDELTKVLADEIAKEVDNDIIKTIEMGHLVRQGWTKVELDRFESNEQAVDITNWVLDNCGLHMRHGCAFVFKAARDATLFTLRWAS